MKRVEKKFKVLKYNLKKKDPETRVFLKFLCHVAKNVYNNALYTLRQQYFTDKTIPTRFDLNKLMKTNEDSKILNSFITICINRAAHDAMSNFVYPKHKNIAMPKYLPKKGYFPLITEDGNVLRKLRVGNTIQFPLSNLVRTGKIRKNKYKDKEVQDFLDSGSKIEYFYIKIPKVIEDKEIKQLSIIPKFDCRYFEVAFTYVDDEADSTGEDKKGTLAIDLGINNLAACVNSNNNESFLIDGRRLKSINQYYNKQLAYYQPKVNKHYISNRLACLWMHRNWAVQDYIYKAARMLIDYAVENKIKRIVVGYNKGFKDKGFTEGTNKENAKKNQPFKQIPLARFKNRIKYLCRKNGIEYEEVNESYTSICSFYDDEEICMHDKYLGVRAERGLFITKDGRKVNADINGALNILKKSKTEDGSVISRLMNSGVTTPMRRLVL